MKYFFVSIFTLLILSCSTRKDRLVNRQYHALVTKYNVMYNGKLAFDKGLESVEKTYQDDFTEVLPIEPFGFYVGQQTEGDQQPIGQNYFKKAEDKAVKAIQKHSMLIAGEERNSQMDEAYLLLGKSRYYTKRFGPALEAFEYIVKNYKQASLIYETVVWRAKANIHNGNIEFGKKALLLLLTSPKLSKEVRQQAEVGVVMAYEKTPDSLELAIPHLEAALKANEKGTTASRVAFVLGQMYQRKGRIKDADNAFDKVIQMKNGLYRLEVQAKLEKINNHLGEYSTPEYLEAVDALLQNAKNRQYTGKLLYEKALLYQATDSLALAKYYLTASIHNPRTSLLQKTIAYEKLGDVSYEEKEYEKAKSYYDSLINIAQNKQSRRWIRVQRKSKSLGKIVATIQQINVNDSLLNIASMSNNQLTAYFKNHIKKIQEQEKQARLKELRLLEKQNNIGFQDQTDWYFYNSGERIKGKATFYKVWGISTRRENWYVAALNGGAVALAVKEEPKAATSKELDKYSVSFYLNKVNRDAVFLDSISKSRNLSYYELGNAYYRQLNEKELAVEKFEKLLTFSPNKDLKVGTYYKLYKIFEASSETSKAAFYLQKLMEEFPNSTFTQQITNQKIYKEDIGSNHYLVCYQTIYELYKVKAYYVAKEEITEALQRYSNSPLAAKYHLLHAYIIAKTDGKIAFEKKLKDIALQYPNTIEANKAVALLNKN